MRLLFLVLFLLVCLIQYPLWLGKGGWRNVWDMQKQVAQQHETNESMRARNTAMQAEVQSLQSGTDAIEERARGDLGMMRDGEVFVEMLPPGAAVPNTSAVAAVTSPRKPAPASAKPAAPKPPVKHAPPKPAQPQQIR
jgi:cell division protein FtsB